MVKQQQEMIGYIELGEDDRLEILRSATGRDLYFALQAQSNGSSFEASLIQTTCTHNGDRMTLDFIENLDADIAVTMESVLFKSETLTPIDETGFPKTYQLGDHAVTVTRNRLIKDNSQAQRMSGGDSASLAFWLLTFLVQLDGKTLRYDDLMEMPAGKVQALIPLVTTKKREIVTPKT